MSATLEQLTRQHQTLRSIRSIVRTMKTMAAVNAAPYEEAAEAIQAWQQTLDHGFAAFAHRMGGPLPSAAPAWRRQLLVAFGSDHGFCGNYNELMAEVVLQFCRRQPRPPELICIGARLERALVERELEVEHRLMPPASVDGLGRLAGELVGLVESLHRGQSLAELAVELAYTRRASHGSREAVTTPLLPLPPALLQPLRRWPSPSLPDFSMHPEALLAALLRHYLYARVFHGATEAMVTENAARLALMQQAEQAVDDQLESVGRQMAGVRQDVITHELMDIVTGHGGLAEEEGDGR